MRIPLLVSLLLAAMLGLPLTASADGLLLSLSKEGNRLHIIDPESGKELATYEVGVGPHEVVTDASGRFAYVSDYGNQQPGNSITVIDLQRGKVVTTIDLGELRRPHGLFEHDGKIYFTSEVAQAVGRIDVESNQVDWTAKTNRGGTHMLVVSSESGEIFTADIGGGTVTVIDPAQGQEARPQHIPVPGKPEGIAISPDGEHVIVGDNDGGTISIIDADSKEVMGAMEGAGMPIRVGFTPDGNRVLSTDPPAGLLHVYDFEKREKVGEVKMGPGPIGFIVNPEDGMVFVSISAAGEVAVVDLETLEVTKRIKTGPVPDGIGLAFPKEGEVARAAGGDEQGGADAAPMPQQAPPAPAGQKPRLGVAVQSAGAAGGVEIMEVLHDSLAQKAGLRVGDVIMKLNGHATDDPQAFADAIYAAKAGDPLKLTVLRGEEELEIEVKLQ